MISIILRFALAAASIVQAGVDAGLTNWNQAETTITPANVSGLFIVAQFHGDGSVFTQPLIFPYTISAHSYNVLLFCTVNNSCFAYDADSNATLLWKATVNAIPRTITGGQNIGQFYAERKAGCVSTPAVDLANGWAFVLCGTSTPAWVLYKLNLATGATIASATVSATSGSATFSAAQENGRGAAIIANSNVYITFSSFNDQTPYNGWVMAYAEADLSQAAAWCATPSGTQGGVWSSGAGVAVDGSGNLIVPTGNGTYDGTSNYANSVVKLSPTLSLLDWFTVSNFATVNSVDADLASNRAILIPGTTSIVHTGKAFQVVLLAAGNMGHLQGGGGQAPIQAFTLAGTPGDDSGAYGSMYMNGVYYVPNTAGILKAFSFGGVTFQTTPLATRDFSIGSPGPVQLTGSSNGATNGIVWVTTQRENVVADEVVQDGVLHAIDPLTLAELWNSGTTLGGLVKFASPTVANGRVYVPSSSSQVVAFGLQYDGRVF